MHPEPVPSHELSRQRGKPGGDGVLGVVPGVRESVSEAQPHEDEEPGDDGSWKNNGTAGLLKNEGVKTTEQLEEPEQMMGEYHTTLVSIWSLLSFSVPNNVPESPYLQQLEEIL